MNICLNDQITARKGRDHRLVSMESCKKQERVPVKRITRKTSKKCQNLNKKFSLSTFESILGDNFWLRLSASFIPFDFPSEVFYCF